MMKLPEWQELYLDVLAENDPNQFRLKLSSALQAIAARLITVELKSISAEEQQALDNALATLRRMKEEQRSDEGAA
jgi:hypothetical protein